MRILLLIATFFLLILSAVAQQITVGPNVHLSKAHAMDWMGEATIAADPTDAKHLIACSMTNQDNKTWVTVFTSNDEGSSWIPTLETKSDGRFSGDPACAIGPDGLAFFAAIDLETRPVSSNRLLVYRSADYGLTWKRLADLDNSYQGFDRESLSVDTTSGEHRGRVYITASSHIDQLTGSSGGRNALAIWSLMPGAEVMDGPYKRQAAPDHRIIPIGNNVVLSDGTLVTQFADYRLNESGQISTDEKSPRAAIEIATSSEGGQSLSSAVKVADYIYLGAEVSGGNLNAVTSLAVDKSNGPFKDRLYLVWADARSGRTEILLSSSSDKGRSWAQSRKINDDLPSNAFADRPNHLNPSVTVNKNGVVGVVWYDRREHPDDWGWDIRFCASLDGGETWTPSVRVSEAPNLWNEKSALLVRATSTGGGGLVFPGLNGAAQTKGSPLKVNVFMDAKQFIGGDYAGMTADAAGALHPIWADNRTGLSQLWTSTIMVADTAKRNGGGELQVLEDISGRFASEMTSCSYDQHSQTVTIRMRLINVSPDTLHGRVKLRIFNLKSELARPELMNSDNGVKADGAIVDFTPLLPSDGLKPMSASGEKTLVFHLEGMRDFRHDRNIKPYLVTFEAKILGTPSAVPGRQ